MEKKDINTIKSNSRAFYYGCYTVIFVICCLLVYKWFALTGKSAVIEGDGLRQHYNVLVYYSRYLKELVHNFLSGNFTIPMWDFHIGFGSDILTTFNYYTIGDPLTLLSVFVPVRKMELFYDALVCIRLYLAGIAFLSLCSYCKKRKWSSIVASIIYVFCGYSLYIAACHPMFINAMIYMPLLILGAKRVVDEKKWVFFSIVAALSAVTNYYLFYIMVVLLIVYYLVAYLTREERFQPADFVRTTLRMLGSGAAGIAMSAVFFLPAVIAFLGNGRLDVVRDSNLLYYSGPYYWKFILGFLAPVGKRYWAMIVLAPAAVIGLVMLWTRQKRSRNLKWGFVILTVFMLVPFFGYMLNGFSYATNRWGFAYALLISYIAAETLPDIFRMTKNQKAAVIGCAGLYALVFLYRFEVGVASIAACFALVLLLLCAIIAFYAKPTAKTIKNGERWIAAALLGITVTSIVFNADYIYSPRHGNGVGLYVKRGTANDRLAGGTAKTVPKPGKNEWYRIEKAGEVKNDSIYKGYSGTSSYYSLTPSAIGDFITENGVSWGVKYNIGSLDGRTYLNAVSGTKYFSKYSDKKTKIAVPAGYKKIGTVDKNSEVYINQNALPLGYTYDSYLTRNEYQKLSMEERQQAMLQSVVLEKNTDTVNHGKEQLSFGNVKVPCEIEALKGAKVEDGRITVTKKNAQVRIKFNGVENAETYVSFDNFHFQEKEKSAFDRRAGFLNQVRTTVKKMDWEVHDQVMIHGVMGNVSQDMNYQPESGIFYTGVHSWLFNFGYQNKAQNECILTFDSIGTAEFDDISVICQKMDKYPEQVRRLKKETMEINELENNKLKGTVTTDRDKILFLSIPYSEGWSIKVNGKEEKLLQANVMYSAVKTGGGKNVIEMTYETPGLKAGAVLSLISVSGVLVLAAISWRKRKKEAYGHE